MLDLAFWGLASVTIASACGVILSRDIFRAALLLVVTFLTVAGIFVLLSAEFLAVVQVLIYAGAISILIIFVVMLTRDVQMGNLSNKLQIPGLVIATLLGGVLVFMVINAEWRLIEMIPLASEVKEVIDQDVFRHTPRWLGRLLMNDFVLAFEVASLVLLSAIIGALALMRGNR